MRAAAVAGLRLLDADDERLLRSLLDDPSPAVAREVSRGLRATAGPLPADWLMARVAPRASDAHPAGRLPPAAGPGRHRLAARRRHPAGRAGSGSARALAEGTVREWNWQGSLQAGWADPAELGALLERSAHLFDIHQLAPLSDRLALTETARPDRALHRDRPAHG